MQAGISPRTGHSWSITAWGFYRPCPGRLTLSLPGSESETLQIVVASISFSLSALRTHVSHPDSQMSEASSSSMGTPWKLLYKHKQWYFFKLPGLVAVVFLLSPLNHHLIRQQDSFRKSYVYAHNASFHILFGCPLLTMFVLTAFQQRRIFLFLILQ